MNKKDSYLLWISLTWALVTNKHLEIIEPVYLTYSLPGCVQLINAATILLLPVQQVSTV